MKRDVDFVREILLELEKRPAKPEPITGAQFDFTELTLEGRSPEDTSEHVRLMAEGAPGLADSSTRERVSSRP